MLMFIFYLKGYIMVEFAHSFWSKPLFNNKFSDIKTSLAITMVDYGLSVEYIHKHGHKIKLYTDRNGFEIFKYIPYDEIIVFENNITNNYHFAASFKFMALNHMDLNTVLIDGDIFLKKSEIFNIINSDKSDLLVSFFEPKTYIDNNREKNLMMVNNLKQFKFEYPYNTIEYDEYDGWYNTSLMKFSNQELKDEYIRQYKHNLKLVDDFNFENSWPDLIIEQRHLTQLLKSSNYKVKLIADDFPSPSANEKCLDIGFTHLGSVKKSHHNQIVQEFYSLNKDLLICLDKHILNLTNNIQ